MSLRSCAIWSSVGSLPDLASSQPCTHSNIGPSGTYDSTLTDFGIRSTLSKNSGKLSQSHGNADSIAASGIASTRVIDFIARSRRSGAHGANPNPQLPITTDVTPCQP